MMLLYEPTELARPEPIRYGGEVWQDLACSPNWVAQVKYNGWRAMVHVNEKGRQRVWSRHGKEILGIRDLELPPETVLDCEVCGDKVYGFDAIWMAGECYINSPLRERIEQLYSYERMWSVAEMAEGEGEKMFRLALALGHEGVVLKNLNAPYPPASGAKWLKVKP